MKSTSVVWQGRCSEESSVEANNQLIKKTLKEMLGMGYQYEALWKSSNTFLEA
jgi:hypothetical protein